MRVTNNLMISKFSRSLNSAATNLNDITEKASTGIKFTKSSQCTSDALKAFKIRRGLSRIEQYEANASDVKGQLDQTETTLMGIQELLVQAQESLIQGANGTMSDNNKDTVASIFESLQEQMLKLANANFAGKYIFGGPNTTTAPFTINAGNLFYNGEDVNNAVINTEEVYVDMGLGIAFDGTGNVQTDTAFSISTPGSIILGHGVDADGMPNNLYNLFGDIITSLKNNDTTKTELQVKKLTESTDNIMVQVAGIGERIKFVDFLNDRLSADKLNLEQKQSDVEDVDQAKAIVDYKSAEMAYNAALQMGSKIIQKTLLDFLN